MAVNEKAYEKQQAPDAVIGLSGAFAVLEAGLEPAQPQWPRDFKSLVSTDSTIRASSTRESGKRGSNSRP